MNAEGRSGEPAFMAENCRRPGGRSNFQHNHMNSAAPRHWLVFTDIFVRLGSSEGEHFDSFSVGTLRVPLDPV